VSEEERVARSLVELFKSADMSATMSGVGQLWNVEASAAGRIVRVQCLHHAPAGLGLVMASPPSSRSPIFHGPASSHPGPEYVAVLADDSGRVAEGRTRSGADVALGARAWLDGKPLEALLELAPFIDERPRTLRALAARLAPELRWDLGPEPACELWIYGDGRSCRVATSESIVATSLHLGQAQVAFGIGLDVPALSAAWLLERRALADVKRIRGLELERHAELIERDPARWHWLHVRDRLADPSDVLAPLKPLVAALAESALASSFYTYSSSSRLCFSASSHYPWVDARLPVVTSAEGGAYSIGDVRCELPQAVELVEAGLTAAAVQPFFGSQPHHDRPRLKRCLAELGSDLEPELVQRGAGFELVVERGGRRCTVSDAHVVFVEGTARNDASWPSLAEAARAIRRYLDENVALEQLDR
jgi:hypothetical protein